jgi:hypothetical protein
MGTGGLIRERDQRDRFGSYDLKIMKHFAEMVVDKRGSEISALLPAAHFLEAFACSINDHR